MGEAAQLGQRWFDTVKTGDVGAIEALLSEDCDFYSPGGPVSGPQEAARLEVPFTTVFRASGGRISVHRAYWDNATFMAQLGLIPAPGG
ncbi:MAG: nuclear transport factor 2 family protein [Actinobacteria bacterium]|nr:nuclear transport factor 2 family protein [Actinomycetota bacterium]